MVQALAVDLLVYADNQRRTSRDLDALKLALVSAGASVETLFPSIAEAWSGDPVDDEGVSFDYSEVAWEQDASPSDWELMQAAMVNDRVTVREPSAPAAPVADLPFETDREWT